MTHRPDNRDAGQGDDDPAVFERVAEGSGVGSGEEPQIGAESRFASSFVISVTG